MTSQQRVAAALVEQSGASPLTLLEQLANTQLRERKIANGPRHQNPLQDKGEGFWGRVPVLDASGTPVEGWNSTEISAQRGRTGKEYPLIYRNIPKADLNLLQSPKESVPASERQRINRDAFRAAQERWGVGFPAFAMPAEQLPITQIESPLPDPRIIQRLIAQQIIPTPQEEALTSPLSSLKGLFSFKPEPPR